VRETFILKTTLIIIRKMCYNEHKKKNFLDSGAVEGVHKHVIQQGIKLAGMSSNSIDFHELLYGEGTFATMVTGISNLRSNCARKGKI